MASSVDAYDNFETDLITKVQTSVIWPDIREVLSDSQYLYIEKPAKDKTETDA